MGGLLELAVGGGGLEEAVEGVGLSGLWGRGLVGGWLWWVGTRGQVMMVFVLGQQPVGAVGGQVLSQGGGLAEGVGALLLEGVAAGEVGVGVVLVQGLLVGRGVLVLLLMLLVLLVLLGVLAGRGVGYVGGAGRGAGMLRGGWRSAVSCSGVVGGRVMDGAGLRGAGACWWVGEIGAQRGWCSVGGVVGPVGWCWGVAFVLMWGVAGCCCRWGRTRL